MTRSRAAALVLPLAALLAAPLLAAAPAAAVLPPVEDLTNSDLRFGTVATGLKDPTSLDVAPDGRVFVTERTGRVKVWDPRTGGVAELGRVGVDSRVGQCGDCEGRDLDEGGLHGVLLARDFATTGHVYLYRSLPNSLGQAPTPATKEGARGPASAEGLFRLSRYTVTGNRLDLATEVPLFENPAEWAHCCHYGGDMAWLADGTLVLSTGDDTISSQSGGYSPRDERPDMTYNNADLTSQNKADRRGKLLRIDVTDVDGDGSDVPRDNPFVGDPAADPYVYALGFRSPYKFALDPATQSVVVGNVGPDASRADSARGPAAHDEIEVVPPAGGTNHGWPRCIADNIAYNDYEWSTGVAGPKLSCEGMTPAAFSYTYQASPTTNTNFRMGSGGNTVIGGVVYRASMAKGPLALPARLHDRLLFAEWSRGRVFALRFTAGGKIVNDTPLDLAELRSGYATPIDMAVSPADGAVYVLEYGGALYNGSNGRLSRITGTGTAGVEAGPAGAGSSSGAPLALAVVPLGALGLVLAAGVRRRSRVV